LSDSAATLFDESFKGGSELEGGDPMTKADIVNALYEKIGLSKKETAHIVEVVLETLKENLEQGRKIKLAGFGNFVVRKKVARKGRNPKTGEEIEISRRQVVTFRPSQILRKAVNRIGA
jgi:integration host factor subunit alpha